MNLLVGILCAALQGAPSVNFEEITPKSEAAIEKGTQWLLRKAQNRDGGFGPEAGAPSDVSCTAMAGLVLLSQGNSPNRGPNCQELRRALEFLMKQSSGRNTGRLLNRNTSNVPSKIGQYAPVFFTSIFTAQILGQMPCPERDVREALERLVGATVRTQKANGSWGSESWAPMLGTVMGWVSLRTSHFVGMEISASATKTATYIVNHMKNTLSQRQSSWMHTLYKNASGIRILYALGMDKDPVARQAFRELTKTVQTEKSFTQAGGEEYLAFYLITDCMMQKGGEDWKAWYVTVREKTLKVQNKDGSWTGHHCITSRTFCTAAALLTLQAPLRLLPVDQE